MSDTLTRSVDAAARAAPRPRTGPLLATILTGQFMALLDASIVNVAAPTIRQDLHSSGSGLQLVIAGYTIAYAMVLITGARLGDRLGHRRIFLAGLALFTAASLACGLAGTTGLLITFRIVQGGGAALMVPQVLSLIQRTFAGAARARALSIYAAVIAGGAIVGQVAGGALVGLDIGGTGWRPAFLINVPIGVVALLAGRRLLPSDRGEPGRGLDPAGLVLLSLAVLALVVPLVLGHQEHWPVWGWVSLGLSAVLLAAFVIVERRVPTPLVPARVLRAPSMLPALISIFATMAAYAGYLFALALHLQSGLGYSPLRAGLTFIPAGATFALVSLNVRRVPARLHPRMIPIALALGAGSLGLLGYAVSRGTLPNVPFVASQLLFGVGFGAAFSPLLNLALSRVRPADAADASGLFATMVQLAQVVGVATFGTLYLSLLGTSSSVHATEITCGYLAAAGLLAAALATLLPRPSTPS